MITFLTFYFLPVLNCGQILLYHIPVLKVDMLIMSKFDMIKEVFPELTLFWW